MADDVKCQELDHMTGGDILARLRRIRARYAKVHAIKGEDFTFLSALAQEGYHARVNARLEKSEICMCSMLGRSPAIATPKLGVPWCHTCGKPTAYRLGRKGTT